MAKSNSRATMNISVGTSLERYVHSLVNSGDFNSASEVVREGIRLVKQKQDAQHELRRKLDEARKDIRRGRWFTVDEVMAEWERLDALSVKKSVKKRKSA